MRLRQIKTEVMLSSKFSNDINTDISSIQEYYRILLCEKPIPGYIEYFVKEPFIIHLYTKRQIEVMKSFTKGIILHLDPTGSIISKPEFWLYYFYKTSTKTKQF